MKICFFCCSSQLDPAELLSNCRKDGDELKAIPLPCSGRIDIRYLTKAFETGADGVGVITCKTGDCRYLEGTLRAKKRAQAVDELLEEAGLGKGRTAVIQMSDGGIEQVKQEIAEFCMRIKALRGQAQNTEK